MLAELKRTEEALVKHLEGGTWSRYLVQNLSSRLITDVLFVLFVLVASYQSFYWSGIYLGLWEYHAKDIFPPAPVHCAHVYVRINLTKRELREALTYYYDLARRSKFNPFALSRIRSKEKNLFVWRTFIRYHFEFGPEDFEGNACKELGSTILHLKETILKTFTSSKFYSNFQSKKFSAKDLVLFNNKKEEVNSNEDLNYLCESSIETGNVIDCIILV